MTGMLDAPVNVVWNGLDPLHGVERLYNPKSIAVIGASSTRYIGSAIFGNLRNGFPGNVYPVNTKGEDVQGVRAYKSIMDVPETVDLAVIVVNAAVATQSLEECGKAGVGGVIIISSGFNEAGEEGHRYQAEVVEILKRYRMRATGPNCIGMLGVGVGIMANFGITQPKGGGVALVSQSGGFGSYIASKAVVNGLGLEWFISTGNEVDVNLATTVRWLLERDEVKVVLMFSETLRNPELFIECAKRSLDLDKPIVLLKAGRTEAAAKAAMSHTASVVGSSAVLDAICEQYGVIIVHTMEELLDLGLAFSNGRRAKGNRIGIMTTSGGAGVLLSDEAELRGMVVPTLPEAEQAVLLDIMPKPFHGAVTNPVDTTAQITAVPGALMTFTHAVLASSAIDTFVTVTWASEGMDYSAILEPYAATEKPFAVLSTGPIASLNEVELPVYTDPGRAINALARIAKWSARVAQGTPVPEPATPVDAAAVAALLGAADEHGLLMEHSGKALLAAYGIPVTQEALVTSKEEAITTAERIGGAVAIKAMSYQLPHKSEYGAIRLGLTGGEAVGEAYDAMLAEVAQKAPFATVEGVLVQAMVPARIEVACGIQYDPLFGPMVMVSIGGVLIELIADSTLLHPPFSLGQARAAVAKLGKGQLVGNARGITEAEADSIAQVMVRLGQLALDLPQLREVDVNPLRVADGKVAAADALIVVGKG